MLTVKAAHVLSPRWRCEAISFSITSMAGAFGRCSDLRWQEPSALLPKAPRPPTVAWAATQFDKRCIRFYGLHSAGHLFKTYSSGLAEKEDVCYKDIWFDDLLRDIGDYFKIETVNGDYSARSLSALIKADINTALIDFAPSILRRIKLPSEIQEPPDT